jgi:hypothetical protein
MIEARLSPDGFVAQRLRLPDGVKRWFLVYVSESAGLMMRIVEAEELADWPRLGVADD